MKQNRITADSSLISDLICPTYQDMQQGRDYKVFNKLLPNLLHSFYLAFSSQLDRQLYTTGQHSLIHIHILTLVAGNILGWAAVKELSKENPLGRVMITGVADLIWHNSREKGSDPITEDPPL